MLRKKEKRTNKIDNFGIYAATISLKPGMYISGVDNKRIALIYIQRRSAGYAVKIEYETLDADGYFTNCNSGIVKSVDDVVKFFSRFDVGDITWIKDQTENVA